MWSQGRRARRGGQQPDYSHPDHRASGAPGSAFRRLAQGREARRRRSLALLRHPLAPGFAQAQRLLPGVALAEICASQLHRVPAPTAAAYRKASSC